MGTVRVAIVGVGNCASSLVQGVRHYAATEPGEDVPGLMHVDLGGYHVRDVEFVAAFDVDAKKVGRDLSEAIFASENNTIRFADVPPLGVEVQRGPTMDGLGKYYADTVGESEAPPVDVAAALTASGAEVLVSYLPVGRSRPPASTRRRRSRRVSPWSTACRCSSPATPEWADRFREAGVPIIGDDIKSQSARPSSTACSPACSRTAASGSTAPTS